MPDQLVALAKDKGVRGIAFTFSEPTLQYEYIIDVAKLLPPQMDVVVKTNGLMSAAVAHALADHVAAVNIDLKGGPDLYARWNGCLLTVLSNAFAFARKCHLELSMIVTPESVDDSAYHDCMRAILSDLDITLHLLYSYPVHRQTDSYDKKDLIALLYHYRSRIPNTFLSNVFDTEFKRYQE